MASWPAACNARAPGPGPGVAFCAVAAPQNGYACPPTLPQVSPPPLKEHARVRMRSPLVRVRLAGALLVGLSLAALAAVAAAGIAADADPERAPPTTRNALWRSIFARPATADVPAPADNAVTPEKIALGYDLFRDTRLSGDGKSSCTTCHDPGRAFTDGRPIGIGPHGARLVRNVPTILNLAWGHEFFWDGRAPSLEEQARVPMLAPDELAGDVSVIVARLDHDAVMKEKFAAAFPATPEVSEKTILQALAAYERSLVSPPTRFDRWVAGDDTALSDEEMEGFALFVGKAGCVACHGGWRFTDDLFHDTGMPGSDPGRGAIAGGVPGAPEFKTPGLRELASTAPYMHDGSLPTLAAVVDHYAGGFVRRPSLSASMVPDLELSDEEKRALVAFLGTLSSQPSRGAQAPRNP